MYPINVDVIHTICQPYGQVARIVIFRKGGIFSLHHYIGVHIVPYTRRVALWQVLFFSTGKVISSTGRLALAKC